MTERIKTLTYRRANFLVDDTGPLETYLVQAHQKFQHIEHRTITEEGHAVLECRNFKNKPGSGVFLHIAAYTPGEHASVVPRVKGVSSSNLQTAAPPDGCEFMDGDTTIFVSGNHVILCSSSLHEKQAERYMTRIISQANLSDHAGNFSISKIADVNKVKLLQTQGVKSIILNSSLFSASIDHIERTTVSKQIAGGVAEQLLSIFKKDYDDDYLENAENLNVSLKLSYDSRKKSASFGKAELGTIANIMVSENDDGFIIETLTGETVKSDDIALRKKVSMTKFGKTVYCDDAWNELEAYYLELKTGGLLEQ